MFIDGLIVLKSRQCLTKQRINDILEEAGNLVVGREDEGLEKVDDVLQVWVAIVRRQNSLGSHVFSESPADVELATFHDRLGPEIVVLGHGSKFQVDDDKLRPLVRDLLEDGEKLVVGSGAPIGEHTVDGRVCNAVLGLTVYDIELNEETFGHRKRAVRDPDVGVVEKIGPELGTEDQQGLGLGLVDVVGVPQKRASNPGVLESL